MTARDPFWSSAVVRGAIIAGLGTLSVSALGAAVDTRDKTNANRARLDQVEAVQAERDRQILADLAAIKTKLGIIP